MDANAIKVVSEALALRIKEALAPDENVYVGPLDDEQAKEAVAVLFLYRVAVNPSLRNSEHRVETPAASTVFDGGLPLDLSYLLTTGKQFERGELESLRLLGVAMQALNDAPNLVVGSPVRAETVRVSIDPLSSEEMSRIWTLFPTVNYRTSVAYLATPVWLDPARPSSPGAPVTDEPHRIGHLVA